MQLKKKKSVAKKRDNLNSIHETYCKMHPTSEETKRKEEFEKLDEMELLCRIDNFLLLAFPLAFFIFNLIYWPYWTYIKH